MSLRTVHIAAGIVLALTAGMRADNPASNPATSSESTATQAASTPASQPASGTVINWPRTNTPLPAGGEGPETGRLLREMLGYLLVICVLGGAAMVVVRRVLPKFAVTRGMQGKRIRVLETASLGPRKALHLVEVGSRRLLLASTPERIALISDVTDTVAGSFEQVREQVGVQAHRDAVAEDPT